MKAKRFLLAVLAADLVLVALAAALAGVLGSAGLALGVVAGGALGTANLAALGWLAGRLVAGGEGAKWPYALALAGKFALLIAAVGLVMAYVPMDVIGFVVGLTASGVAMVAGTAWLAARKVELTP